MTYKRKDFDVFIKTNYNKYSDGYTHVLKIYKILRDGKYENLDLYNNTVCSTNLDEITKKYENFRKNFIVASAIETDLNNPLSATKYDTVWLVDFSKNIVKCLNGVTGYESYYIDDILKFKGDIFAPCSGTKGRWNRLEVNYIEFREQLEIIIKEYNKGIDNQDKGKLIFKGVE